MKRSIRLDVHFVATISDPGNPIPHEFNEANETISIEIPVLDPKFVVFPKMLEGVTDRVISQLHEKVAAWHAKKAKEEERLRRAAVRPPLFPEREA